MKRVILGGAVLVGLVLLTAAPASAQVGQVRGKVLDSDGQAIRDADVAIEFLGGVNRKFEVKTSKRGEYLQVGLEPGPYRVTATKEGYQGGYADVRVSLGEPTEVPDITLMTLKAAAQQPGSPESDLRERFGAAAELANSGKGEEAEAAYQALLADFPDVPEIYQNLGVIYAEREDWAAAEASLQKALELRPGDSTIMGALAGVYQQAGQPEKAMEYVDQAAGSNPEDAGAQFRRGVFLLNAGKMEEAVAAFEAALAADPTMAEAHYHVATLLVGQGKVPEAVEHLEAFLALNPTNEQYVATAHGLLQALKK